MLRIAPLLALPLGAALLAGCARSDMVVVLPESDGHVGAVVVQSGDGKIVLDKAYAAAAPGPLGGAMKPAETDAQEVNRIFGSALAAQPIPPKSFTLYFENDSDVLVPESRADFEGVFADIAQRKAAEIVITGHTDTMGTPDYNDSLSLDRAKAVAHLFTERGVPPQSVTTAGRGRRDLLVPTGDQVPEPRNRRVVITVR
jgi:OOP family OmpA-OmpF porin